MIVGQTYQAGGRDAAGDTIADQNVAALRAAFAASNVPDAGPDLLAIVLPVSVGVLVLWFLTNGGRP